MRFFLARLFGWLFFENREAELARNELQFWVQEQIYGTTVEAESKVQDKIYSQETMKKNPVSLDVDTLIEASLDRR